MNGDATYVTDTEVPPMEPTPSKDEIKDHIRQLATQALDANTHSYKSYLCEFGKLIESYVAKQESQNVRGVIFLFACEYDYHLQSEIEELTEDLPLPLSLPDDTSAIDAKSEEQWFEPIM